MSIYFNKYLREFAIIGEEDLAFFELVLESLLVVLACISAFILCEHPPQSNVVM